MPSSLKLAVLASGNGSNFQAILDAIATHRLQAQVRILIVNNPAARALDRAKQAGVSTVVINHREFPDREAFDKALGSWLDQAGVDLVVLAGFMRVLGSALINRYKNRIVNIHPSLLPAFPGLHAIEKAHAAQVTETGVTVHIVDTGVDTGPILAQQALAIVPGETLESLGARVHAVEHELYPKVLQWFAENRVKIDGGKVTVRP